MADSLAGRDPNPNAMPGDGGLVGVVLAAGEGRRLLPLSAIRPKPLCPVGGVALVDLALDRVRPVVADVAVNVHHGREPIQRHLERRAAAAGSPGSLHVSVEEPEALGTAGALGALRQWIDGRGVLVHNSDVWAPIDLASFVEGWDGERVRVLIAPGREGPSAAGAAGARTGVASGVAFGPAVGLVATLLPWSAVSVLGATPSGLYETTLRAAGAERRLDPVTWSGPFVDCGTPRDYLDANLEVAASSPTGSIVDGSASVTGTVHQSVVGAGAVVAGSIRRCVVWDGATVAAGESLTDAIRTPSLTVVVAPPG
jgi:N-acetyl-alpha-D-muramate 1-phosphate uridylyltransferase